MTIDERIARALERLAHAAEAIALHDLGPKFKPVPTDMQPSPIPSFSLPNTTGSSNATGPVPLSLPLIPPPIAVPPIGPGLVPVSPRAGGSSDDT